MHEVVVRNRLEQLRKRQRDEALVAQEELLAGNTKPLARAWGGDMHAVATQDIKDTEGAAEDMPEAYERSMSPMPIDLKRLSYEDRQLPIISEEEDIQMLVSIYIHNYVSGSRLITPAA